VFKTRYVFKTLNDNERLVIIWPSGEASSQQSERGQGSPFRVMRDFPLTRVHHELNQAVLIVSQGRETKTSAERSSDGGYTKESSEGRPGGCDLRKKVKRLTLRRNMR
jgi:hypothetical protein